jgi:hypothetical protein
MDDAHDSPSVSQPDAGPGSFQRALAFLLPVGDESAMSQPGGRNAAHWYVPIGLAIGVVYAVVFNGVWSVYGEYFGLRLLPAAALLILDLGFFGNRLLRGACAVSEAVADRRGALGEALRPALLTLVLLLFLKSAAVLALPRGQQWTADDWRRYLFLINPPPVLRPLILMAMWGRWSVLLALGLGRARAGEPAALLNAMDAARFGVAMGWLLPCVALTVLYCGVRTGVAAGMLVSSITLGAAYLTAVLLSWRFGGLTRASVYAAGLAGELAFLLGYIPFANRIYGW